MHPYSFVAVDTVLKELSIHLISKAKVILYRRIPDVARKKLACTADRLRVRSTGEISLKIHATPR